jgi:hypothetical protein
MARTVPAALGKLGKLSDNSFDILEGSSILPLSPVMVAFRPLMSGKERP